MTWSSSTTTWGCSCAVPTGTTLPLRDHDQRFKQVEDNNRKRSAKTAGSQLLDAFGYYLYDIDGQPGSVRLGKQVVNWGRVPSSRAD
ncbi:hypothetical protein PshuTeo2_41260 [Pseudomonas hunanensis]|nr:hypothetical protein [Pseudomonas hunanensis]